MPLKDREARRKYDKEYHHKRWMEGRSNPDFLERHHAAWRRWWDGHKEACRKGNNESVRRWYTRMKREDPEAYIAYRTANNARAKANRDALKAEMIQAYGGKCVCCDEATPEFLTLDHANGDGKAHRARVGESHAVWRDLKKRGWPEDGYRLLCMNCNWVQRYGGSCPHERRAQ